MPSTQTWQLNYGYCVPPDGTCVCSYPTGVGSEGDEVYTLCSNTLKAHSELDKILASMSVADIYKLNPNYNEVVNGTGVGSQLWKLLEEISIVHKPNCRCLLLAKKMNEWGPSGCREHRAEIIRDMKENSKEYGWGDVVQAAKKAFTTGLVWELNVFDIYGGLIDIAIRRTEKYDETNGRDGTL